MLKYVLGALVLLPVPCVAAAQSAAQATAMEATRLAYVSPQRAFYASNDGKTAQTRLATLQSETARELDARNAQLKAMQQELAERGSVLADSARREREQAISRFQIDLERFVEDAQARFLGVRRDLENAFLAKFAPALDTVAKKRQLLFVFNEDLGTLAWADPSMDITADVVAAVNQP